jgi:hypothetical protein
MFSSKISKYSKMLPKAQLKSFLSLVAWLKEFNVYAFEYDIEYVLCTAPNFSYMIQVRGKRTSSTFILSV